jgi:tRNA pseudouridine32 synthase / 23S rRNA pseudouridine746 synthase
VLVTWFDLPPRDVPARMPSPFAHEVHPLAARAADELTRRFGSPDEGKMFGVLVVATPAADRPGRVGYLAAFSGMLDGRWRVPGFVGPAFDEAGRGAWWPAGEAELAARSARIAELERAIAAPREQRAELISRHEREASALRERHAERRRHRHAARRALDAASASLDRTGRSLGVEARDVEARDVETRDAEPAELDAESRRDGREPSERAPLEARDAEPTDLDAESRRDGRERRELRARQLDERARLEADLAPLERALADAIEQRAARSRELTIALHASYVLANARGERRSLAELFHPVVPPTGAGDCAAVKLLAHAYREGLVPLALGELWLGPPAGGRLPGRFYPACRGKCGPLLGHMLAGLAVEPPPVLGEAATPRVVLEDPWLVIADKPHGVLSVPGRERDCSLQSALRARYPELRLVHRLDLDTSGLVVAARDLATYRALQAAFAERRVDKRYVAVLDGAVTGDAGTIELPLRVDLDDRPRQIVDPVHGKPALTDWRVLSREGQRTRVALWPRTGRTHQLRIHAAIGLGAPIVGDRLYGRGGERLLLHAEALAFDHPHTGQRIELASNPPF